MAVPSEDHSEHNDRRHYDDDQHVGDELSGHSGRFGASGSPADMPSAASLCGLAITSMMVLIVSWFCGVSIDHQRAQASK